MKRTPRMASVAALVAIARAGTTSAVVPASVLKLVSDDHVDRL